MSSAILDAHRKLVKDIAATIRQFHIRGEKFRINHGSTNSTRLSDKGPNVVDISALSNVLAVNESSNTCLVEPNVPMDRLVEATLRHGLIPYNVMEFPGITVGGGYSGTSGESSSFRHGYFDRTINQVEMVLADGEVVTCSAREKADLFHGSAGAVGTLGVTTLVELRLKAARKFVETTYHPVNSISEAVRKTQEMIKDSSIDYIDGILFSPSSGAVITGRATDRPISTAQLRTFSQAGDPWFYLHVQEALAKEQKSPLTEVIPLADYLFRYDRGGFWVGTSAFKYFFVPFNRLTRWFLDDFLHTRMMYTALHASGQSHRYIVQDLALPYATAEQFINYTHHEFDIWPLWLCPLKQSEPPTFHPNLHGRINPEVGDKTLEPAGQLLNIGLWGQAPQGHTTKRAFALLNRRLEAKLKELGGMKWLYAQTFYTAQEFWSVYSPATQTWYNSLRDKYRAGGLPSVYDKVGPSDSHLRNGDVDAYGRERESWFTRLLNIWPLGGLWGLWKAIASGTYKDARKASWKHTNWKSESNILKFE